MRWNLALSLMLGGLVAAGCSSTDQHSQTKDDGIPMSAAGDAIDEKYNQEDPVCGMRVNTRSSVKEYYGGRTWWFDSHECWQKFHDNPTAYLPGHDQKALALVDPVCGKDMDKTTAFYREEYDGKMYYFDSKDCWQKFRENPHAFMPGGDDRKTEREVR